MLNQGWGSQVAAWDVVEQAGWGYVIAGLLGHILRLVVRKHIWLPLVAMMGL